MKKSIKKELTFIGRKFIGGSIAAIAFIAVAGTSLWALAAFSEPSSSPAASIQDFATNVLGANNADNSFDSSSVTANADGSVLERLEALEKRVSGVIATATSARTSGAMGFRDAVEYCLNLSATAEYVVDGSNTSTTYTDWRMPMAEDFDHFVGSTVDTTYLWTGGGYGASVDQYFGVRLSDGDFIMVTAYNGTAHVRCVR